VSTGHIRTWAVQRLIAPTDKIVDDFLYETPFFTQWKESDARNFSIRRKSLYKSSIIANSAVFDYANPIIELNRVRKPDLPRIAGLVSDFTEHKLIVNHELTTGKFLFGLSGNGARKALELCSRARNPWEAYATGGYKVHTLWRGDPRITSEVDFLLEHLLANVTLMSSYMIKRLDVYDFDYTSLFPYSRPTKRDIGDKERNRFSSIEHESKRLKSSLKRISMSDLVSYDGAGIQKDDSLNPQSISNILGDIGSRLISVEPVSEEIDSFDEDLFLEEYSYL
jgi:hypothetical protein